MADSGLPEFPRADDRTHYEGMCEAARVGLPVAVHAENHDLVQRRGSGATIRDYLDSRIATYRKLPDMVAVRAELEHSQLLQSTIWLNAVTAAVRRIEPQVAR